MLYKAYVDMIGSIKNTIRDFQNIVPIYLGFFRGMENI